LLTQKGDFDTSTKHFYRAMKIAEETGDGDLKEAAKVNFGMANASMKWTNHVSSILNNLQDAHPEAGPLGALNEDDEDFEFSEEGFIEYLTGCVADYLYEASRYDLEDIHFITEKGEEV
jgi:hypothetical protein